jgi:carboxyl-terminal processing protease
MIQKAVKAFVDAIDDPYTVYMDSEQNSGFQEEIKGEANLEGIGAVVTKKDYYVMIEEVIKSSPAYNAGLMALDRIIYINTGSTKDLTVDEAVAQIRGPKGTKVKLTIERVKKSGEKELLEKEVTRDKLVIPSVNTKIFTGAKKDLGAAHLRNIGYINISIIGEETENILKKEIKSLKEQNVK